MRQSSPHNKHATGLLWCSNSEYYPDMELVRRCLTFYVASDKQGSRTELDFFVWCSWGSNQPPACRANSYALPGRNIMFQGKRLIITAWIIESVSFPKIPDWRQTFAILLIPKTHCIRDFPSDLMFVVILLVPPPLSTQPTCIKKKHFLSVSFLIHRSYVKSMFYSKLH